MYGVIAVSNNQSISSKAHIKNNLAFQALKRNMPSHIRIYNISWDYSLIVTTSNTKKTSKTDL